MFLLQKFILFHFCFGKLFVLGGPIITIIASIYWAFTCRHYALSLILIVTLWSGYLYLHFIDEETDSGELSDFHTHSRSLTEPGFFTCKALTLMHMFLITAPTMECAQAWGSRLHGMCSYVFVCPSSSCFVLNSCLRFGIWENSKTNSSSLSSGENRQWKWVFTIWYDSAVIKVLYQVLWELLWQFSLGGDIWAELKS